jgi:acetyltransferase
MGALAHLLLANPHLSDIEVNPLRLHAGGLMALDAVFVTGTPSVPSSRDPRGDR